MFAQIRSLFSIPAPRPTNFVTPGDLTTFQRETWHHCAPICLTERALESLVGFLTRSLTSRWSLDGPYLAYFAEEKSDCYVVLLEAETESGLLEIFRALADSPAAAERLSLR